MSATTEFIAELIRAANEIGKLTRLEKRRLMSRGSRTIREMRLETGILGTAQNDILRDLERDALRSEDGDDELAKSVLLGMADMIRTLKIILDAKNEVTGKGTTH